MESSPDAAPLVCIVGCTASGKSALAFQLAQKYNGEIIAADSRTIYRTIDIGTAKPTLLQRQKIPHHLIDILEPNQVFAAADFKFRAQSAITDISRRGKLPVLVGGTGLYIDSVLFDFSFRETYDTSLRERLKGLSIENLQAQLHQQNIPLPQNARNRRHLIRTIETAGAAHFARKLRPNTEVIGLDIDRQTLKTNIEARVAYMIEQGLEDEVHSLVRQYGWGCPGMQTIGYKEWKLFFDGAMRYEEVADLIVRNTLAYAKRQQTWFKRNKSIQWLSNREEIEAITTTFLSK